MTVVPYVGTYPQTHYFHSYFTKPYFYFRHVSLEFKIINVNQNYNFSVSAIFILILGTVSD